MRTLLAFLCTVIVPTGTVGAPDYPVSPVPAHEVRLLDTFWAPRLETNRAVTIPYAFAMCETTGRVDNFALASGRSSGEQCGVYPFDDSDLFKVIEGASYVLISSPDPRLDRYVDSLISLIGEAQEADGYLYTARTNAAQFLDRWAGKKRWSRLSGSHELYNLGHLYEAAAAHYVATDKRNLLEIARKSAALLQREFRPGGLEIPPGHQEIEIGLARLYRVTGDSTYLRLARFFLDQRGRRGNGRELWGTYSQDHLPVLRQEEAVGHAVRALYMISGMLDVAALANDPVYADAAERLWNNIVTKKIYLTGGVGAQGMIEGFGPAYDLPNKSAYCETCASIAHVLASHRLFLLRGDAGSIDILERTLYNAFLSGVSMSGDRFFYPNPLASRRQIRSRWFDCACCPSNVTRFVPQIPGFIYARRHDTAYVNLYVASETTVGFRGTPVRLRQETAYPWEGGVRIAVEPQKPVRMTLAVRVPGWSRNQPVPGDLYRTLDGPGEGMMVSVGDEEPVRATPDERGYVKLSRRWSKGNVVRLTLPMPVRRTVAHDSLVADRGRVALERGPLVYCAEWIDQPGGGVFNLVLPDSARVEAAGETGLPGGVRTLTGGALAVNMEEGRTNILPAQLTMVPYYARAHRGHGEMVVWLPRSPDGAEPAGGSPLAARAAVSTVDGTDPGGINDGNDPRNSLDTSGGFWRTPAGDTSWVEYRFPSPEEVSAVDVYWYDDGGSCTVPASWRVLLWFDGRWVRAYNPDKTWGVSADSYNRVLFEAFRTDAIRLEVVPREGVSAGVLEWRVY